MLLHPGYSLPRAYSCIFSTEEFYTFLAKQDYKLDDVSDTNLKQLDHMSLKRLPERGFILWIKYTYFFLR